MIHEAFLNCLKEQNGSHDKDCESIVFFVPPGKDAQETYGT